MNSDDWKLQTPDEESEFECSECGTPLDREWDYFSNACFKAGQL